MSGFEGIKNYNAQDDKIFSLIIFSGVVNLLKQCSDKMHEPWKMYHCINIQAVCCEFAIFAITNALALDFLMNPMNNK